MSKKILLGYLLAFALALVTLAGMVWAQTPTPSTQREATPTPQAPATGLGGGY